MVKVMSTSRECREVLTKVKGEYLRKLKKHTLKDICKEIGVEYGEWMESECEKEDWEGVRNEIMRRERNELWFNKKVNTLMEWNERMLAGVTRELDILESWEKRITTVKELAMVVQTRLILDKVVRQVFYVESGVGGNGNNAKAGNNIFFMSSDLQKEITASFRNYFKQGEKGEKVVEIESKEVVKEVKCDV